MAPTKLLPADINLVDSIIKTNPDLSNSGRTVKVIAVIDYSCPYCKYLCLNLPDLMIDYADDAEVLYVNYPLSQTIAARAAICAEEYNEFKSFHEQMFLNQKRVDSLFIMELVNKKGINEDEFIERLNSDNTLARLNDDINTVRKLNCHQVPTLIVNGIAIDDWSNTQLIKHYIEVSLRKRQ